MKLVKKFWFPLSSLSLIFPIAIVSCSNENDDKSNEYISDLKNLIEQGQVSVKFNFEKIAKKSGISIFAFEKNKEDIYGESAISLEVNENKILIDDNEEKQKRISSIKEKISSIKISYSKFLLPKLHNDGFSEIFFNLEMNSNKKEVGILFSKLASDNEYKINNLSHFELVDLIEEKVFSIRNIVSNISSMISLFLNENIMEQTNKNSILISEVLQDNISRYILRNSEDFFKEGLNYNTYIPNKISKINTSNQYFLNIYIWTDKISEENKNIGYKLEIPFKYEE